MEVKNVIRKNGFPAERCDVASVQGPSSTSKAQFQPETSAVWAQSRIEMEKNIAYKGKELTYKTV